MNRDNKPQLPGEAGRVVRTLKEGYWDRTEIVELPDGSQRVRKSARGDAPPGPWGVAALRREIEYLATLPERSRSAFPPLLARWDESSASPPRVGYEVPYYPKHPDAGHLARAMLVQQPEVESFQELLADLLLGRVHEPVPATAQPLSAHVTAVVEHALLALEQEAALAPLIRADTIRLNGEARRGTRAAFERIASDAEVLLLLDGEPQVRLHGDFFLENVLWRRSEIGATASELLLIDPVSVAGIAQGPPSFDLVKYESYASGELFALRSALVEVGGFDGSSDYWSRIRWEAPELRPFRERDWRTRFRARFEEHYGASDSRACRLLDGYFSVAMAVNTNGNQRRARLLKATCDFNAAAEV